MLLAISIIAICKLIQHGPSKKAEFKDWPVKSGFYES